MLDKKKLRSEMLVALEQLKSDLKLKSELKEEPNLQYFKDNYKRMMKENNSFDEIIRRTQIIDGTILLKFLTKFQSYEQTIRNVYIC